MKRSRKILSWMIGVLLACVTVMLVLIATFDWNRMKPLIDDKLSEALGRPFVIHGDLRVQWQREPADSGVAGWLPWPEFTAGDVSIGNPAWAERPQFAQLNALRFRLSPWALLAHRLDVRSLQLVHPIVDLERDKSARATWNFSLPPSATPSSWTLTLDSIGFDRGVIMLNDAVSQAHVQIDVTPLQKAIPYDQIVAQQSSDARAQAGQTAGREQPKAAANSDKRRPGGRAAASLAYQFDWTAAGSYQGSPFEGHGRTGAVLALQDSTRPFPLQADMHVGDSHIALVGTLTDPLHLGALDVRLWLSGSSMAKLYPIIGITLPDTPPYATEGELTAELQGTQHSYRYNDFRGRVGASDLAGNLLFVTGGERPKLSGDVHSKLLRFSDLAPLIGAGPSPDQQHGVDDPAQPPGKLLPVAPFRTDRWRTMDADVNFTGDRIVRDKALPIDALNTHLVMKDGAMYLDPLQFELAGGRVRSNITLDGSRDPMQGLLKLDARHLKLKQLFPTFEPMKTSFGEINGNADLKASGNSIAALLGSADGELKLLMNDGAISKNLLETAGLNVANIVIGKLFGDKTVKINCAAADMTARHGLFDMRLFVFDTEDATIKVDGTVNLADEKLDLDVQPHTKGLRILSLRSPLYVKGSLKNPDVGVQTGPLLLRGAGAIALAVVAAPAAALLALVAPSRDNDGNSTCRVFLDQLRQSGRMLPASKPAAKSGNG